jgi:hypothetical protein
MEYKN